MPVGLEIEADPAIVVGPIGVVDEVVDAEEGELEMTIMDHKAIISSVDRTICTINRMASRTTKAIIHLDANRSVVNPENISSLTITDIMLSRVSSPTYLPFPHSLTYFNLQTPSCVLCYRCHR